MNKLLVDSNVLSEPTKVSPAANVVSWLIEHRSRIVVNPIVLGEIEYGILRLSDGEKKRALSAWFHRGIACLEVLDFTSKTAGFWARLVEKLNSSGKAMPVKDSLVAATALEHNIAIATRNRSDFEHCGVTIIDPFAA